MRLARLRTGEVVAALGAILLAVALTLPWYEITGGPAPAGVHESGLRALGWLALLPLVLAVLAGLGLALATLTERTPALPLAVGVSAVPLGLLAMLAVAVRLLAEPGLGAGATDGEVVVRLPALLGLLGASAVFSGAWIAIADERTDTAEARAQTERALAVRGAPRPVPPPRDGGS